MVIYQTFFSGNTEREIPEELGLAAAVVHRLKKRALQHLREILCGGDRASKMPAKCILYYGKKLNQLCDGGAAMTAGMGMCILAVDSQVVMTARVTTGGPPNCQRGGEKACVTSPCGS